MLRQYYDINKKDSFKILFGDTYISRHKTAKANSYYVLYFNFSRLDTRSPADPNIVADYKKLSSMFDLYSNTDKDDVLQSLMNNEIVIGDIVTSFSLSTNFTYDHFISLLYYLGLITIEDQLPSGRYRFRAPNQIIKDIYYDYYFTYLTKNFDMSSQLIKTALLALERDDEKVLIQLIERLISESTVDNKRYLIHFRENTLPTLFYLMLRKSDNYNVCMEVKVNTGYVDILYTPIEKGIPYVFEFKYLTESRYKEDISLLEKAIADINRQIEKDISNLGVCKAVAIIFVGENCMYHSLKK